MGAADDSGAEEEQEQAPPPPPRADGPRRNPVRAAAQRPASVWQLDGYRATTAQAHLAVITEPTTLEEALASEQAPFWRQAMDEEYASLLDNNTWTLERTPRGVNPIPVKWVFKIKRDSTGAVERYKARLVAKGFRQREGIDYVGRRATWLHQRPPAVQPAHLQHPPRWDAARPKARWPNRKPRAPHPRQLAKPNGQLPRPNAICQHPPAGGDIWQPPAIWPFSHACI